MRETGRQTGGMIDRQKDRHMKGRTYRCMIGCTDRQTNARKNRQTYERMQGHTNRLADGRTDGRSERRVELLTDGQKLRSGVRADRHTDTQTTGVLGTDMLVDGHTDRYTDAWIDRRTDRRIGRLTGRQTYRSICTERGRLKDCLRRVNYSTHIHIHTHT